METSVVMTFGKADGTTVNLRVPRARPDLSQSDVRAAMSQILSVAALNTKNGDITNLQKATLHRVTHTYHDFSE